MKEVLKTTQAPAPIGPYSQAIKTGNLLFVSGQIALNPTTGELELSDIKSETKQVMENLKAILLSAGFDFTNVVKTTIFLTNMEDFPQVNETYGAYFNTEFPARETVEVSGLPKAVNVEISVIAANS